LGSSGSGGGTCHLAPRPLTAALPALLAGVGRPAASPPRKAIGAGRMTGVPLVLALARGRLDALRVVCMPGHEPHGDDGDGRRAAARFRNHLTR